MNALKTSATSHNFWIDLVDLVDGEGNYTWFEADEPLDVASLRSLWAVGEPNNGAGEYFTNNNQNRSEDCAALFVAKPDSEYFADYEGYHARWSDLACSESFAEESAFICERTLSRAGSGIFIGDMYAELDFDEDQMLDNVGK